MARTTAAAIVVLIATIQYCSGQNGVDLSDLGRLTNFLIPTSCADPPLKQLFTGVHEIQPSPGFGSKFEVLCDQTYDKGGWIVIQNRADGSVSFQRGWDSYVKGFGNLKGDFWLGLDKISEIVGSKKYQLAIVMTDSSGVTKDIQYSEFRLGTAADKYTLWNLGSPSDATLDDLSAALELPFATSDDDTANGCAASSKGGWWYVDCGDINLNGLYKSGGSGPTYNFWKKFSGANSLKSSRIMVRPVK